MLPLDYAWPEIQEALASHINLVLVAEPGAGKTTRFPPRLLASSFIPADKKILVLEPRRLAARASAVRIAQEQNWTVGNEIGYQVRFENKTSAKSRIQFLTEGLLSKRLQNDPELKDIGAVILDEFHERSQHTDLALGLLFELQQLARPDLRIIVMSATLDAESVSSYLTDAPAIKVPGRTFPVDVFHASRPLALEAGPDFMDRVAQHVLNIAEGALKREGDLLVFLPGAREIRGVRERVTQRAERAGFDVVELHGSLPLEEQDRAIRKGSKNKICLSTNIAETSLTIDGVGTVVDSGLARISYVDSLGFTRLSLSRISLASATQRAGRAGRQAPGLCYRLWNKLDESSMAAFETPEILRTDLTDPLLSLLSQGVTDAAGFSWFEKPNTSALLAAQKTLVDLGFRDPLTGALTPDGQEALKLPVSARLARLVLEGIRAGSGALGSRLAALLSERDVVMRASDVKQASHAESDILVRYHLLSREGGERIQVDRVAAAQVRRVAEQIEGATSRIRLAPRTGVNLKDLDQDEVALRLLLLAFPDRLCRRRKQKELSARMVGGKGVWLSQFSTVETAELFVALDSAEPPPHLLQQTGARSDAQITIASRVEREWVEKYFPTSISRQKQIVFDAETLSVQKLTAVSFRDLALEAPHVSRPTSDEAFEVLTKACQDLFQVHFLKPEHLGGIFARLLFLKSLEGSQSDDFAYTSPDILKPFFEEVCFGETKLSSVLEKKLDEIYLRHLPTTAYQYLETHAPAAIQVPSGSRIQIHYPEGREPYLEVRIQEIFGLRLTPRVGGGRVPIVIHLLGPNFRPVQVTSDLESFWRSGYSEVRKELRLRYPKHSWPEDPTDATPEAKGRRRQ